MREEKVSDASHYDEKDDYSISMVGSKHPGSPQWRKDAENLLFYSPIPNSEEPLFYWISSVVSKISPATAGFINSDIIAESSIIISSAWSYYVRNNHKFGKCRIS